MTETIVCVDPMEGYLTNDKEYPFLGIEPYAGRVVTMDDRGKECHCKPERFIIKTRGAWVPLEDWIENNGR